MSKSVLCEEKDNICLITLNEEDTRNAISPEIINELVSILEEIDNVLEKPLKKVPDRIKIIVSEESWIIIEEENDENLIYELMQNEEREVLGYRPLIFKIGNPEATKIFINNKIINISRISKKDANYSYFEIK